MAVSVGLIGLGEVAQLMHLPLLADDPRIRISAVTDVSPSLTNYIAARYGLTTGAEPKTTPADSLADLELFAAVGAQFLR